MSTAGRQLGDGGPSAARRPLAVGRRRLLQRVVRAFFAAATRVVVTGMEHLPRGPALLAANHLSHADPALLLAVLPTQPEIVGLADLRARLIAPFFFFYGVIPVRRDEVDRTVVRAILAALARGEQVMIFPEARISRSGALEPARAGIGYLALQAGVPVVPVALTGTEALFQAWRQRRRPRLTVAFAPPLCLPADPARSRRAQRTALTHTVMQALAAQLPPRYRGVYGNGEPQER